MKTYKIAITKLNNQDRFCEALQRLSGYTLDTIYGVVLNTDFPIDFNDLWLKFNHSNNFDFVENKMKITVELVGDSADLEVKQVLPKTIEPTAEEIFENKKRAALKLKIQVEDFIDAENWKNSLNETDIKRLHLLQRVERYMNTPR